MQAELDESWFEIPSANEIGLIQPSKDYDPRKLSELLLATVPLGWRELLDLYQPEIRDVGIVLSKLIINQKHKVCPQPWNIWRALRLTPWPQVKVVILGQDPYPQCENGKPAATGCCFECRPGEPIQRSLEHIFCVLAANFKGEPGDTCGRFKFPDTGDLSKWATQGVLLLNCSLTMNAGEPNSHKDIWGFFPLRVLQFLAKMRKNVVYMLWGRDAKKYEQYINKNGNLLLEASHPVARGSNNTFLTCTHFRDANEYLVKHNQTPIDWVLPYRPPERRP